jgi:hypothetical protein
VCRPERAGLAVADILRDHAGRLALRDVEHHALLHILACRTQRLGGHLDVCDKCGARRFVYHSCRDRHCPRCGGLDQALWADAQGRHLLPVTYFHLVFTVPQSLRPFFRSPARKQTLALLFAAVAETILDLSLSCGFAPGILAVLHTWSQRLEFHPHIHCLVTGGGLDDDGDWVRRMRYLLPLKRMRPVFAGKLLGKLEESHKAKLSGVAHDSGFALLRDASRRTWNIFVKQTLAGPEQAVRYFARYTKRIAISESRLLSYDGHTVVFRARDRKQRGRSRPYPLDGPTFARRFLQHVLPPRFVRIRRYGLLANRASRNALAHSRAALAAPPPPPLHKESRRDACLRILSFDPAACSVCGQGRMFTVARWGPLERPPPITTVIWPRDP